MLHSLLRSMGHVPSSRAAIVKSPGANPGTLTSSSVGISARAPSSCRRTWTEYPEMQQPLQSPQGTSDPSFPSKEARKCSSQARKGPAYISGSGMGAVVMDEWCRERSSSCNVAGMTAHWRERLTFSGLLLLGTAALILLVWQL